MKLEDYIRRKALYRSLLLGSGMMLLLSGCCLKPRPATDHDPVIVVENSDIVENTDGTFTVSKGWMLERIDMERRMGEALSMCVEGEL